MFLGAHQSAPAHGAGGEEQIAGLVVAVKGSFGATPPLGSDGQSRQSFEHEPDDGLVGTGVGQVHHHLGLPFDDTGGDLQQAQSQRVELGHAPGRTRRHQAAQRPHHPVGAGVQHQAQLIGAGAAA